MYTDRMTKLISAALLGAVAAVILPPLSSQTKPRVFEMRTYTATEGHFEDLMARFRNHTLRVFAKHGMTSIGYWVPQDGPVSKNTIVYIIAHESREAATKNWAAFRADPEWQKIAAESERNGRIVQKVESVFLDPTDYSPIK
jgi:hypothetical protein